MGGGGGVGCASFAFRAGLPLELIKILGADWRADAVLLYFTFPLPIRLESVNVIASTYSTNFTFWAWSVI